MSLENFSTENDVFSLNGREITDWGETATPLTMDPIDPKGVLRRGQGGSAIRLDRKNPGRRVTINLNPGSADATYVQGLMNSKATLSCGHTVIGTLEVAAGSEGMITNDGSTGRAGSTITDNQFIMEFNQWVESK